MKNLDLYKYVYATCTVQKCGDQFEVVLCDRGEDRAEIFDRYHDARAWAGGRYAQGFIVSIEDKVAAEIDAEQNAEIDAAIERDGFATGVSIA